MEATEINSDPSSYRPLCMLDSAGKLLEKLFQRRLAAAIETAGGFWERQYGFWLGRSVEWVEWTRLRRYYQKHIVVLATFHDIKALRERLRIPVYLLRILRSNFKDRKLFYDTPSSWIYSWCWSLEPELWRYLRYRNARGHISRGIRGCRSVGNFINLIINVSTM